MTAIIYIYIYIYIFVIETYRYLYSVLSAFLLLLPVTDGLHLENSSARLKISARSCWPERELRSARIWAVCASCLSLPASCVSTWDSGIYSVAYKKRNLLAWESVSACRSGRRCSQSWAQSRQISRIWRRLSHAISRRVTVTFWRQ